MTELLGVHLFGCPRPGFQRLAGVLAATPINNWRNGDAHAHDFVTNVPFNLPTLPYVEPREFKFVSAPPLPGDRWGPFAYHHMHLYYQALLNAGAPAPDTGIAQLLIALYDGASEWDLLLQPQQDDGICLALKRMDGYDLLLYRGSTTTQDWLRDFMAGSHSAAEAPGLGPCHEGMLLGMPEAHARIKGAFRQPVRVAGHSLGAGRAAIEAGLIAVGA